MAPTGPGTVRTRTTSLSLASVPAYPARRRGDVVLFSDRWAVSKQPLTTLLPSTVSATSLAFTRTGTDDGARPACAVIPIETQTGRKSTDHTTGAPAVLAVSERHLYRLQTRSGVTPAGITSRRAWAGTLFAGNISIVRPLDPAHIEVHEGAPTMGQNYDPDETAILDLGIFRRSLIQRLGDDGIVCEHDMAVIRAFDEPHRELGRRLKLRQAFDSVMRNGVTRRSSDRAREAGFQLIVSDSRLCNVVAFPGTSESQEAS